MNASLLYFSREEGVSFSSSERRKATEKFRRKKKIFADRSPINGGGISEGSHPPPPVNGVCTITNPIK